MFGKHVGEPNNIMYGKWFAGHIWPAGRGLPTTVLNWLLEIPELKPGGD